MTTTETLFCVATHKAASQLCTTSYSAARNHLTRGELGCSRWCWAILSRHRTSVTPRLGHRSRPTPAREDSPLYDALLPLDRSQFSPVSALSCASRLSLLLSVATARDKPHMAQRRCAPLGTRAARSKSPQVNWSRSFPALPVDSLYRYSMAASARAKSSSNSSVTGAGVHRVVDEDGLSVEALHQEAAVVREIGRVVVGVLAVDEEPVLCVHC